MTNKIPGWGTLDAHTRIVGAIKCPNDLQYCIRQGISGEDEVTCKHFQWFQAADAVIYISCLLPLKVDILPLIRKELAEHHAIALIWQIDDIQHVDLSLSDEDAWEILQAIEDGWDAEHGVSWAIVKVFIEHFKENRDE